ncbi:sulfite exporter TauE/SafE family protein [Paucisalibacillus sp. EB02]|uniref:sulfite exporter TauE/SafE family protein n=1 Tax=Paucisalibacillus sp. EB02 TaxID=1347087 RepID=UPI0004ACB013|nr:sulfite exporter TauE/SafE family protein [Paucisalibacillus sp. EB02]
MDIMIGILLLTIGIFAGGYGTIVGAGGGFIFVPALLLLLDLDPQIAAGSGLVIVLINSLSGMYGYAKQKLINYKVGIKIIIGAIPGAVVGVWLLSQLSSQSNIFYWTFASLLLALGIFLFFKNSSSNSDIKKKEESFTLNAKWFIPLGLIMGIISSFLGIGGGWLLVPILIYIFKLKTHQAAATSIFSLGIYSFVGVSSHIFHQNIDWVIVLWGGLGVIVGSQLGVFIAKRLPGKVIIKMLSILLCIIGFRMYFS